MYNGQSSDKVFESAFKKDKLLTETDKAFIVQQVYHLIRYWRLFTEIQAKASLGNPEDIEGLFGIGWTLKGKSMSQMAMFKPGTEKFIQKIYTECKVKRALAQSIPDWLDEIGHIELGNRWPSILQSLNEEPPLVIRTNTLKISRDRLHQMLTIRGIKTRNHDKALEALIFNHKINVFKLPEFKAGLFEVQDVSSQMTGYFANPKPGMRVIDGCAGNGGKTLQLAGLMQNKGKIIALDIYPAKLETLKQRARRAGISIIETRLVDSTKVIKRLHESADLILLDVPCSGLGVLKRNPEIKWRLQPSDLENLKKTQEEILERYSRMVNPGGKLVYSTCSILPSENEYQIQKFLDKQKNSFELTGETCISPESGFDGFYMAKLKRSE
jgi:16S rRNA (cytosine967-C5)-methyltransferase